MTFVVDAAPPNSLVLITGSKNITVPDRFDNNLVVASHNCIAVGCQSETDGNTKIIFGHTDEVDPGHQPSFFGTIETPERKVFIKTIHGSNLLIEKTANEKTLVSVWANHPNEPDELRIGVL